MSRDASHGARSADSDVLAMLGKDAVEPEFDEIEDAPDEEEWADDEELSDLTSASCGNARIPNSAPSSRVLCARSP